MAWINPTLTHGPQPTFSLGATIGGNQLASDEEATKPKNAGDVTTHQWSDLFNEQRPGVGRK
jgi:hypothetical protein